MLRISLLVIAVLLWLVWCSHVSIQSIKDQLFQLQLTVGDMQKELNCIQNQYQDAMP